MIFYLLFIVTMNQFLYIGTNLHIEPINHFPHVNKFIFIDSLPLNNYGFDYYYRPYYDKTFVSSLIQKFDSFGFSFIQSTQLTKNFDEINIPHLESTLLVFKNKERIVHYYISTCIPLYTNYNISQLDDDISNSDSLIISGHFPHGSILKLMKHKINFIGYSQTYYPRTIDEITQEDDEYYSAIGDILLSTEPLFQKFIFIHENKNKDIMYLTNYSYLEFHNNYTENKNN